MIPNRLTDMRSFQRKKKYRHAFKYRIVFIWHILWETKRPSGVLNHPVVLKSGVFFRACRDQDVIYCRDHRGFMLVQIMQNLGLWKDTVAVQEILLARLCPLVSWFSLIETKSGCFFYICLHAHALVPMYMHTHTLYTTHLSQIFHSCTLDSSLIS